MEAVRSTEHFMKNQVFWSCSRALRTLWSSLHVYWQFTRQQMFKKSSRNPNHYPLFKTFKFVLNIRPMRGQSKNVIPRPSVPRIAVNMWGEGNPTLSFRQAAQRCGLQDVRRTELDCPSARNVRLSDNKDNVEEPRVYRRCRRVHI